MLSAGCTSGVAIIFVTTSTTFVDVVGTVVTAAAIKRAQRVSTVTARIASARTPRLPNAKAVARFYNGKATKPATMRTITVDVVGTAVTAAGKKTNMTTALIVNAWIQNLSKTTLVVMGAARCMPGRETAS